MTSDRSPAEFLAQWEIWHRDREVRRASPHGFLSITGLHWLNSDPQRFDDAPGTWTGDASGVRVRLDDDETLFVDDARLRGHYDFGVVDARGVRATFGDALVEVCRRDEYFIVRPRHPDNPIRTSYQGTPAYPANIAWAVPGVFVRYDEPLSITVDTSVDGLTNFIDALGEVVFQLAGETRRLIAFNDDEPDELFVVFTDLTAGESTYPACRFLTVDAPTSDGRVTVDFNRAWNPPCAYTDFATCPLPPAGNHTPVRVEAGEKLPFASR